MGKLFNNGLPVGSGLKIEGKFPADDRLFVAFVSDLDALEYKHDKMKVYVAETDKEYRYDLASNTWSVAAPTLDDVANEGKTTDVVAEFTSGLVAPKVTNAEKEYLFNGETQGTVATEEWTKNSAILNPIVVAQSTITAEFNRIFNTVVNCTIADPENPIEGLGYWVNVVNGTATVPTGGVTYGVGTRIFRHFENNQWKSFVDGQALLDGKVDKDFLSLALTSNINVSTLEQNRVYVVTLGGANRTITIDVPTNILFILDSANVLTFAGDVTPLNDDLTLQGIGNSMLIEHLSGTNSLASKKGFTQINPNDYPLNNFPQPVTQRFLRDGIDRKADIVAGASFTTGTPRTFAVTFGTAFPDTDYTITICGVDSRQWSYQDKGVSGFTINSNSGADLTGEVTWTAERI